MKTILATLVTIIVGLVALPGTAEARPHDNCSSSYTYLSGNTACGCPVYTKRVFVGYDCYHRPIYRYYSVPVVHRCRSHYRPTYHNHPGHGSRYYNNSRYPSHRGHSSHISLRTRYGNVSICR
ncbi:MAG: hypothetical protein H7A51_12095 [Akkermansiaceae bacterium]|nr:hypothetical protein [Akkermansiaceae bacterium]